MNRKLRNSGTFKLAYSAILIAIYIIVILLTQGISFRLVQVRVADALFALIYLDPYLILPMALANALGNVIGGIGMADIIGGFVVGLFQGFGVYAVRRLKLNEWLVALPSVVFSALIVPLWLAPALHVPFWLLSVSIALGEVPPGILGVLLIKALRRAFAHIS